MLFIRKKRYLMPQNGGYGGLIALFLAANEGRPSETLKIGFSDGLMYGGIQGRRFSVI